MDIREEFKTITAYNEQLTISNLGKVFKNGLELKQNENFDGYLVVYIGNNRNVGVHRLVAMAFVENDDPINKNEVNHKDFNRKNNKLNNLAWLSHSDNVKYSHENGRYSKRYGEDNPNFGNKKLSKFYKENPDISKLKQSRKGSVNGNSKSIKLFKDGVLISEFDYIGDCCKYLHENHGFGDNAEVVRCGIRRSISHNSPYKGFTFEK